MRKGKVKKSAAWLMIAMLTTCVLSSAVYSGENPWDSDNRPKQSSPPGGGSDSVTVSTTDATRTGTTSGSAASSYETGWMQAVHHVVFFVARHYGAWHKPSPSAEKSRSTRW